MAGLGSRCLLSWGQRQSFSHGCRQEHKRARRYLGLELRHCHFSPQFMVQNHSKWRERLMNICLTIELPHEARNMLGLQKVLASIPFPMLAVGFSEPMVKMISQHCCQRNFECQASWPVITLAPTTLAFSPVLVSKASHQPQLPHPSQILASLFHVPLNSCCDSWWWSPLSILSMIPTAPGSIQFPIIPVHSRL